MASDAKSTVVKVKPNSQAGGSSSSIIKKKVFESSTKRAVDDSKPRSASAPVKTEVKGKTILTTSEKATKTTTVRTREKKAYSLAGQKFDVPEEREPLRIFYESLSKQIPSSEMAEFWMMEHGLLSPDKARKAYEKKQIRQKQLRMGTPVKSPPPRPPGKPQTSKKQQLQPVSKNGEVKAKKKIIESDDDDDFILGSKRRKG